MGLISQADFARHIARHSGRTVESCQVSLAQWVAAGHLGEGDGLNGGLVDTQQAAMLLLERLDLGQATGNGLQTTIALETLAGIEPAPEDDGAQTLHQRKLAGQARLAQANATLAELKLAQQAGDVLARELAESALAQVLETEITAWRQFLDDAAETIAGENGLDGQAVRVRLRDLFREHRTNRSAIAQKVANALAADQPDDDTGEGIAAQEVAEG